MKKIKLKINTDLSNPFSYGHYFLNILRKYYDVELSENPDYVLYNESDYEYLKYDCVRILFTGENITPNFNFCDYAMGFDYMNFGDRYYRLPLYLVAQFYAESERALAASLLEGPWQGGDPDFTKQKPFTKDNLAKKTGFCSFVYSNYLADKERQEMFTKLSAYKQVDSGGAYLNNVGGRVKSKLGFELSHKFSIAFENSSRSGYTTEKLVNALVARTIPIYWGDPDVAKEFNQERFINCHAYKNFDDVVEMVKKLDQDDELYLKMVNQPIAAPGHDFQAVRDGAEKFLRNIFDQPVEQAKRRTINAGRAAVLEEGERLVGRHLAGKNRSKKFLASLYKPFKQIVFLDRLKQKLLSKRLHGKAKVRK